VRIHIAFIRHSKKENKMEQINLQKVVIAGLAGTLVMSILMVMAPVMGMPKMDMGEMLGTMNPMVTLPYWMGWIMHFIIGIILTGIYAAFFLNLLPSDSWKRGLIWGLIPFFVAQLLVMPMMGAGVFSGGNMGMIMGSLIGHLVYGGVAGFVYGDG
jgi:predicted cobalt transporter CbtA